MAKIIFIISILIFLIVAGFFFFQKNMFFQDKLKVKEGKVCFSAFGGKDICFDVELALNKQEQIQGLMFRKSLDKNKGMFFVYEEIGNYNFWMKNTLIPLDIIWINENKQVVFINENTQPCKEENCNPIIPGVEAKYVLELNSGVVKEIGLRVGDTLAINIEN